MINALHSSRQGGKKNFTLDGQQFGWQVIIDMFERECQRMANSNARMVPKLREAHIIRDSWIKLNVAPAKIMQVVVFVQWHVRIMHYIFICSKNKFLGNYLITYHRTHFLQMPYK